MSRCFCHKVSCPILINFRISHFYLPFLLFSIVISSISKQYPMYIPQKFISRTLKIFSKRENICQNCAKQRGKSVSRFPTFLKSWLFFAFRGSFFTATSAAAAGSPRKTAGPAAALRSRTANTFCSVLFCFIYVSARRAADQYQRSNDYKIRHRRRLLPSIVLISHMSRSAHRTLCRRALSALRTKYTTNRPIATTTASPGAKPVPRVPSVISVPI